MKKTNRKIRKWLKMQYLYQTPREKYGLSIYSKSGREICKKLNYTNLPF